MDEQLRSTGRRARWEVESSVDVDGAWVEHTERRTDPVDGVVVSVVGSDRPSLVRWLAVAAAAALVAVGLGVLVLRDDPDGLQTADDPTGPTTSAPAVAPVTTSVTAPSSGGVTTVPSDDPPTTTTPTTSTSTSVPDDGTLVTAWRSLPWERTAITRSCDRACTRLVVGPSGTAVSYDPLAHTLTNHAIPTTTRLPDDYANVWLEIVGPDDVAYLVVASDAGELAADLVAVPTTTGTFAEIGRWSDVVDASGDGDLVAGPDGLIGVGCCGEAPERPAPDDGTVVPWLDGAGAPGTYRLPSIVVRHDGTRSFSVERDGGEWAFEAPTDITARAMHVTGTFDGGVLARFSTISGESTVVVRGWPDGAVDLVWLDAFEIGLDPLGVVVVPDGDRFARVQPFDDRGEFWDGEPIVDVGGTGAATFPGLDDALATEPPPWAFDPIALAHAVAGRTSVEEWRTVTAERVGTVGRTVTVTTGGFLDDSVAATRLELDLERGDDGAFRVVAGRWSQACRPDRGHQVFSPELCV